MVMASSRLKCHQKKYAGFAVYGVRNVSTQAYSCKKPETPDISRCPAGLIFDHASEGFWREGIAWAMKRNRHSTAVRVAVLLVAPTLRTQEESVTDQGADDLPCRE
jgi:hypothetical protein